jgi:hypothetical protein
MTHRTTLFMALFVPAAAGAQWTCDSLSIPLLRYSAFHDTLLEVRVTSTSFSNISYPTLVVYDNNGDTLAWDYGNFFTLGPDQTFLLPLAAGVVPPVGYFDATVEVYTNGTQLQCTLFRPYTNLCPIEPCTALYPSVISAPSGHLFDWTVADTDGNTVATGIMAVPEGGTQVRDTVCLPPGDYSLGMVDITGIDMSAIFYMVGSDWWNAPTSPHVTLESGSVSSFVLFEDCFEGPDAITEVASVGTELRIMNGILYMQRADGGMMHDVTVIDATGRSVRTAAVGKTAWQVNIADLSAGVLIVQVTGRDGMHDSRAITWSP